jgi:hypothetical protein
MAESRLLAVDESFSARLTCYDSDDAQFADTHLQCEDGIVKAHSLVLAAHSPLVRRTVEANPLTSGAAAAPEGAGTGNGARALEINLRPSTTRIVKLLRTYIYTGTIEVTAADAGSLITAASRLQINHLKNRLENEIVSRFITAKSACAYLLVGRMAGAGSPAVEGAAREYIRRNTAACFASQGFFDLDLETLLTLLKDSELSIREDDLFRRCLAWAAVRAAATPLAQKKNSNAADGGSSSTTTIGTEGVVTTSTAASTTLGAGGGGGDSSSNAAVDAGTIPASWMLTVSLPPRNPWDKADPQLTRKMIREGLLSALVPYIRFPVMGAQSFARTVVPSDALPTDDVSALLMYFMAPDVTSNSRNLRFETQPRKGAGSCYTWSPETASSASSSAAASSSTDASTVALRNNNNNNKASTTLSGDCRTIQFRESSNTNSGTAPSMFVTEQAFTGGQATVYMTTWGCEQVTIGVVASDCEEDDGDCAQMMVELASPVNPRFEGLTIRNSSSSSNSETAPAIYITAATHGAYMSLADSSSNTSTGTAIVATSSSSSSSSTSSPFPPLRDGCPFILALDWDLHRLTISVHHKGESAPKLLATLNGLATKPLRLALGAVARPSGGDVDGIVTINNKAPAYL